MGDLTLEALKPLLESHPWRDLVTVFDETDSTNSVLRKAAEQGAPEGTVVLARRQTNGRGRQGRNFSSEEGGVYLSLLLRPQVPLGLLNTLTPRAALAAADAVEKAAGVRPQIKWINDLLLAGKKFCGILTELEIAPISASPKYVIVGVGMNVKNSGFPSDIAEKSTSLSAAVPRCPSPAEMAAKLLWELYDMNLALFSPSCHWLSRYRRDCITLGKPVRVIQGSSIRLGTALDVEEDGGLLVRFEGGEEKTVYSGEVSVRGAEGYI